MSKYTKQLMLFKEISGKKVEIDFDGGEVSSDAGILLLKETESEIGIINKVAEAIIDKRHQSYVKHETVHLLTQRVFQIASGYEDGNDCNELRHDPIFKMSCDRYPSHQPHLAPVFRNLEIANMGYRWEPLFSIFAVEAREVSCADAWRCGR